MEALDVPGTSGFNPIAAAGLWLGGPVLSVPASDVECGRTGHMQLRY